MVETTASALALGSLAGCLGDVSLSPDRDADGTAAQASFFVFGDFASKVAGDVATAETLVPVGQHGHGWEPGPQIQGDALDADLFVHGTDGFQTWADDVEGKSATTARTPYSSRSGRTWTCSTPEATPTRATGTVTMTETATTRGTEHDAHDEGSEHGDHDEEDERDGDDDHSGGTDPHFWLDPVRAKRAVETVREGFESADGANADARSDTSHAIVLTGGFAFQIQ